MSVLPWVPASSRSFDAPRLRLATGRLTCETARSIAVLEPLRDRWDQLVEAVGCSVYLTYDLCKVWWDHYGAKREARVFLFRDQDELVGIVPMCIHRVRLGPVSLRLAKIIGSDFTQTVCDLPVHTTWAEVVFDELLERLINDDRCDAILFGPFSEGSSRIGALRGAAERRPDLVSIFRDRVVAQHTTIALPDTFDDYMKSLSRNQRSNFRKGWKQLSGDFNVRVELATDPQEVSQEIDEFVRMHSKQWGGQGKLGHFDDWPGADQFNRSLVAAMSRVDRVRFLRLRAGNRVVARQYSFVFGDTCYCCFAARAAGPQWAKHGLGRLSLVKLFEQMIEEGVRTIDAGIGHYDYKLRLGGRKHNVRSILLVANRKGVRRRAGLFCTLADVLDRLYYRLWFCRVAPRLPCRHRPLWKTWIRSRV